MPRQSKALVEEKKGPGGFWGHVIHTLLKDFKHGDNRVVVVDQGFTSVALFCSLREKGFHAVGTMNSTFLGQVPASMVPSLPVAGDMASFTAPNRNLYLTMVHDRAKKPVKILSTFLPFVAKKKTRTRIRRHLQQCPSTNILYNSYMNGCDVVEQSISYVASKVRVRKGWFYLFRRFLYYSVNNAYVVYNENNNGKKFESIVRFTEELQIQLGQCPAVPSDIGLVDQFEAKVQKRRRLEKWLDNKDMDKVRLQGTHHPFKKKLTNSPECSWCRYVYSKARERERAAAGVKPRPHIPCSRMFCSLCDVPLCNGPCWQNWHSMRTLPSR